MRRINRVLEETPEILDPRPCCEDFRLKGRVEIRDLSHRYPGQSTHALRGIDLSIEEGETLALVGRVGSGKSTFLQVLPRLLDVPPETIFFDGRDITRIPLRTLRGQIGFVTQEVFVFSDTIRNNVLFGRDGVGEEELASILQAAGIYEEIQELDKGVDTFVGERGITLSGGQRQRLTLARALLKDPPILILDDALSMVDTRTEAQILNQIRGLRRHRTNLIVSHRLSTLSLADRIAVLDKGEMVDYGTHDELMARGGLYAALYERQLIAEELDEGYG